MANPEIPMPAQDTDATVEPTQPSRWSMAYRGSSPKPLEVREFQERADYGFSHMAYKSEGINDDAADRQRSLLRKSSAALKKIGIFPQATVIVNGNPELRQVFFVGGIAGLCVDGETGDLRLSNRPDKKNPERVEVDFETQVARIANLIYVPLFLEEMANFYKSATKISRLASGLHKLEDKTIDQGLEDNLIGKCIQELLDLQPIGNAEVVVEESAMTDGGAENAAIDLFNDMGLDPQNPSVVETNAPYAKSRSSLH